MNRHEEYSLKVNSLTQTTVENILEIGRLMLESKEVLEKDEYELFLNKTSYKEETSTVRKWNRIGESYIRLKNISHYLPPSFSTIYKLSTLDSNKLNGLIEKRVLIPTVTLKEINDELNPPSNLTKPISVVIDIDSSVNRVTLQKLIDSIQQLNGVVEVKMTQEVKNILQI